MQSRRTLTLTLSLSERERGPFGGTVSGSPNRHPRNVRSCSPLPARSGERIKVRGLPTACSRLRPAWRDDSVESCPSLARSRINNLNFTREWLRRNIRHPDPKPAFHLVAIKNGVGLADDGVEAERGRTVCSAEGF